MKFHFKMLAIVMMITGVQSSIAQQTKNKEIQHILDTTIAVMKANAANKDKVNWASIKQHAFEQAAQLDNPYQLGNVMRDIFKALGDFHGSFFYRDSTFKWIGRDVPIPDSVKSEWKKRVGIKTQILDRNIGYIRIPSISTGRRNVVDQKAQTLNDSLCAILSKNLKGIIIDLRINGGGDMHPMVLGMEQVLGDGLMGSFETKHTENWYIKNNRFLMDTMLTAAIIPKCTVDAHALPCVVLIGTGTGSSGEFLAMAFKGRSATTFMGTETAGWITVVQGVPLADAYVYLSVGYGKDRKGRFYKENLQPDIYLKKTDKFNDLVNDEKIIDAVKWLRKQQ